MMHDMTQGPIRGHVLRMMSFMLVTMVTQVLYNLIDTYWVSRLGKQAIAAVGMSGNLMFVVIAISQAIGVGVVALVSQAAGRKSRDEVQRLFNQSQSLSIAAGLVFLLFAGLTSRLYVEKLSSDADTAALAMQFLHWFIPAMGLQFAAVGLGSSLRGIGDMKPGMIAATGSILLNAVVAPFLIFGWLGFPQMGVAGGGCASLIAAAASLLWLAVYLRRDSTYLRVDWSQWKPDWALWRRMLGIGLPSGVEFLLMSVVMALLYYVIRPFGAEAQAGFGIGMVLMRAGFMPAVALSFGAAAVAGQNFGAKAFGRVRETFVESTRIVIGFMLFFMLVCHVLPTTLMRLYVQDAAVVNVGVDYLRIVSWNYVASGMVLIAAGIFQGIGNTLPSLFASAVRLLLLMVPVLWLSHRPGFTLHQVWLVSVGSVAVQMVLVLALLRREFGRRLKPAALLVPAIPEPTS
jgi:putative MATE family efflux protein